MYEIIDAHAHIYPDNIAKKAAMSIGSYYGVTTAFDGSVSGLLSAGAEAGVSMYLVHSVATTIHQVESINSFLYSEMQLHPEFIGFMALHPDMNVSEMEKEIDECIQKGFKGVKLHPDMQRFAIDGDQCETILRIIDGRLPILFHMGDRRYNYSHPYQLSKVAEKYPNQRFIAAHFGGYDCWDECPSAYKGLTNVWFDTSSSLAFLSKDKANELIRCLNPDRFFFASDYPMWRSADEVRRIMELDLDEEQRKGVFSLNLRKFLGIY